MNSLTPIQIEMICQAIEAATSGDDIADYEVTKLRRNRETGEIRIQLHIWGWEEERVKMADWDDHASGIATSCPEWNEELRLPFQA